MSAFVYTAFIQNVVAVGANHSMHLNFLTLNVQGFKNVAKQTEVIAYARNLSVDFLCLQGTHFTCKADVVEFETRFRVLCFFSFGTTRSCGTGIILLRPHRITHYFCTYDTDGLVASLDVVVGGQAFRVINVYAPARITALCHFFASLDSFLLTPKPVVLLGDFNCVLDVLKDTVGRSQNRTHTWETKKLRELVAQFQLFDVWRALHPSEVDVTWTRRGLGSRLDRFYLSASSSDNVSQ